MIYDRHYCKYYIFIRSFYCQLSAWPTRPINPQWAHANHKKIFWQIEKISRFVLNNEHNKLYIHIKKNNTSETRASSVIKRHLRHYESASLRAKGDAKRRKNCHFHKGPHKEKKSHNTRETLKQHLCIAKLTKTAAIRSVVTINASFHRISWGVFKFTRKRAYLLTVVDVCKIEGSMCGFFLSATNRCSVGFIRVSFCVWFFF